MAEPAHQPGVRDGVVRHPEWPVADQRRVPGQLVGHRVDARHVQRLVDGHTGCKRP